VPTFSGGTISPQTDRHETFLCDTYCEVVMTNKFVEKPTTKRSVSLRRPILGVGINDANYEVYQKVNGNKLVCPYYERWTKILTRCYSSKYQKRQPTYIGCSICEDWIYFSNFKNWMKKQDWQGKEIDKDVIEPGNKIYSPENCAFIKKSLNTLLTFRSSLKGLLPRGVCINKREHIFRARVNYNGKSINIGSFDSASKASDAYINKKVEIILEAASQQTDERIANGLRLHAGILLEGLSD
jgi:hypothetical protein